MSTLIVYIIPPLNRLCHMDYIHTGKYMGPILRGIPEDKIKYAHRFKEPGNHPAAVRRDFFSSKHGAGLSHRSDFSDAVATLF